MKLFATLFVLALWPGAALAERAQIQGGPATIPPEWQGIWATTDTVYSNCSVFQSTSTESDTLCANTTFEVPDDGTFELTCTSSANATSYTLHCTGSGIVAGCTTDYLMDSRATRTAETYFSVTTITTTASGPSPCDLFPPQCIQVNTHGTRTGPVPPGFCVTPTWQNTWGTVKIKYR